MEILKPIVHETVWGGAFFQPFSYSSSTSIGHLYCFIDSEEMTNQIIFGKYKGKTLHQWFIENKSELGLKGFERLPFLSALVEARESLSIQVHPNDVKAKELENVSFGKNESFYILRSPTSGKMYNGVTTRDFEAFQDSVLNGDPLQFVDTLDCSEGDYIYVEGGTLHAASAGSLSFEIEENCEFTYRFFDFNRKDKEGKPRPLQKEKALKCVDLGKKSSSKKAGEKFVERFYWSQLLKKAGSYKNDTKSVAFVVPLNKQFTFDEQAILPGTAIILMPGESILTDACDIAVVGPSENILE